MITATPTENLTGITLEGNFDDFYQLTESIHRMTGREEDYCDAFWGVKNRLLGVCYEIRHAYMGNREVKLADNGVHGEMMKWHSMILPKQDVHYSVNILFPEAVFVALSVSEIYLYALCDCTKQAKKEEDRYAPPVFTYAEYIRDKANLNVLSAVIMQALGEVIGDDELRKIWQTKDRAYVESFRNYLVQYVDKCNIEYLKTAPEKRSNKIKNIAKRMVKKPDGYYSMERDMEYVAMQHACPIQEIYDPRIDYPEEIEW